jgi:(p)ppGpp synthase/HD superfamily hydrolase
MAVAALVLEYGGDEDETIAALLHDAAEDAGGQDTLDEIHRIFGERVAGIVEACSDTLEAPKPEWRARKDKHLARLVTADASILLVLAADKLHNTISISEDLDALGAEIWNRFRGGREGTQWYLDAFATAILRHPECVGSVQRLAQRLRSAVDQLLQKP